MKFTSSQKWIMDLICKEKALGFMTSEEYDGAVWTLRSYFSEFNRRSFNELDFERYLGNKLSEFENKLIEARKAINET